MKKALIILAIGFYFTGCGGSGGGGGAAPAAAQCTRDIFNSWSNNTNATFNLVGFSFNQSEIYNINFTSGETCQMDVIITGSSCSGTIAVSDSQYIGGGGGDPGCSVLNGSDTYNIVGSTMDLCTAGDPNDCTELY